MDKNKSLHNVKIKTAVNSSVETHVFIDGEEIREVNSATVYYGVGMLPKVFLILYAYTVDVQAEEAEVIDETDEIPF